MITPNHVVPTINTPATKKLFKEELGKIVLTTDEKIFNGSYGIEPVLIRLEQLLTDPKNKINTLLINISTCIRNAMDKTLSDPNNVKKIQIEIEYIVDAIISFCQRSNRKHLYVVFYINDYITELPNEMIRPPSPGKLTYFELVNEYCHLISKTKVSTQDNVTVNFSRLKKGTLYAKQLYGLLRDISLYIPSASYTGYYAMISHQPLDYHLLNMAPNGIIIASHTGEILKKEDLGYKVFDEGQIPFNQVTHRLFGDKQQIQPLVKGVARKKAIEKALANKWRIRTEDQIKTDIKLMGITL